MSPVLVEYVSKSLDHDLELMYKYEQVRVYDANLNILSPQMCFQAAAANGSNILLLKSEREIDITKS